MVCIIHLSSMCLLLGKPTAYIRASSTHIVWLRMELPGKAVLFWAGKKDGFLQTHLPCVWLAVDASDPYVCSVAAVKGCIALLDVDGRIQDRHPALPVLAQHGHKTLYRRHTWQS